MGNPTNVSSKQFDAHLKTNTKETILKLYTILHVPALLCGCENWRLLNGKKKYSSGGDEIVEVSYRIYII
jgi:hypothetical protein